MLGTLSPLVLCSLLIQDQVMCPSYLPNLVLGTAVFCCPITYKHSEHLITMRRQNFTPYFPKQLVLVWLQCHTYRCVHRRSQFEAM